MDELAELRRLMVRGRRLHWIGVVLLATAGLSLCLVSLAVAPPWPRILLAGCGGASLASVAWSVVFMVRHPIGSRAPRRMGR